MLFKLFCIFSAASLPFLYSLNGDFVFDDSEAIVKNPVVTSESWLQLFYTDFWGTNITSDLSHKSYRPLTVLTFRLNYLLNGKSLSATKFKLTNLMCHIVSCLLLWLTLKNIVGQLYTHKCKKCVDIVLWCTLLFAVHPVHVEAVSGIVGRADLLAAVTFFLAFLAYNKAIRKSRKQYIYLLTTVVLAAMSMLFKENGITVLGVCFCFELLLICKINKKPNRKELRDNQYLPLFLSTDCIIRITVLILAALLLVYGRWLVMGGTTPTFNPTDNPAAFTNSQLIKAIHCIQIYRSIDNAIYLVTFNPPLVQQRPERRRFLSIQSSQKYGTHKKIEPYLPIGTYCYVYFLNGVLLVWPYWLCYDWSMGCVPLIQNFFDYRLVPVLMMFGYGVNLAYKMFRARRRRSTSLMTMALALMMFPFLPAANIFYPVGFVVAERVLYIPSVGFCLFVVVGLNKLLHAKVVTKEVGYMSCAFVICVFGFRSYERSFAWQNEHQLFVSGLSVCPLNAKVHYNVAKVADARHQTDLALAEYREAIRLYPEYYQAMNNLANLLKTQREYTEAVVYLKKAIRLKQNFPAAWMNLGIILVITEKYGEAEKAYETALKYRPNYPDCLYNLGNLYLDTNQTFRAMENWLYVIKLMPTHELAWTNVLGLLDNTAQFDKALEIIPFALTSLPEVPSVHFAIANIYGKVGRYEVAEKHFLKTIELLGPKAKAIHFANLGVLYHRWKKYENAEAMYRRALKIDANFKSAIKNLNNLKLVKSTH